MTPINAIPLLDDCVCKGGRSFLHLTPECIEFSQMPFMTPSARWSWTWHTPGPPSLKRRGHVQRPIQSICLATVHRVYHLNTWCASHSFGVAPQKPLSPVNCPNLSQNRPEPDIPEHFQENESRLCRLSLLGTRPGLLNYLFRVETKRPTSALEKPNDDRWGIMRST